MKGKKVLIVLAAICVLPLLASWALVRIFVYVLRGVFPHGSFLRNFERFATFAIWGGMVLEMTGLSDEVIEWLEQVSFNVGKQRLDLWMILHGLVTIFVTVLGALWLAGLAERAALETEIEAFTARFA